MSLQISHQTPKARMWLPGLLLTGFCLGACTVEDDDLNNFVTRTLAQSVAGSSPIAVNDQYAAFPASELGTGATGTDFNGDGDFNDDCIVILDLSTDVVVQTGSALDPGVGPEGLAWVNNVLFFAVAEGADSTDWNTDMDTTDKVLVYWHAGMTAPLFYDTLDGTDLYESNGELFYVSDTAPVALRDSNLFAAAVPTAASAPTAPRMIQTSFVDPGGNGIHVSLRGESNGVLWMTLSEITEGGNMNGDSDALDSAILGLMGTGSGGEIQVVPQALRNGSTTVEPLVSGVDRLVAYFVDEATQGANLNDPALFAGLWQATQCSAVDDADTLDEVLHWLNLTDYTADPVGNPAINTGLVGGDQIYSLGSQWLGVIGNESDEGSGGGCDLNGDGDNNDDIFRWVETTAAPLPVIEAAKMIAIDTGVAGGSGGVIALNGDLWVAVVDEAADGRNYDGDVADNEFVGVLDPNLPGTSWNFDQGAATFLRVSWMAPDPDVESRFLAAIKESSTGIDRNNDGDLTDSIPTFPIEAGSPRELDFPGVSVAIERNNAGITTRGNFGYYRISEADQRFDYNLDGDQADTILQRVDLTGGSQAISMGVLQNLAMDSIMAGRGANPRAILWLAPENLEGPAGTDLNGDGDANDLALRYARIP
ncbi:MAG: hypothetical protein ACI87O_000326 [Planctomycetota bacterium]|jgi:hypothetical protein